MKIDFTSHKVRSQVVQDLKPDGSLMASMYVRVIKGRFYQSIGRVERVEEDRTMPNHVRHYLFVVFEAGGRTYKFEATDAMYNTTVMLERTITSDKSLKRVDENDNKKIPKLTDRYGTPVTVGLMMVVHTHVGLRIGTVKSITPKGSIRFRDFDDSKAEFTKQIWEGGGDSQEIMALQKDFMDQMLLRKLARC